MNRPRMSVQLYTVREKLASDPRAALDRIAQLGLGCVEPFGLVDLAPTIGPLLQELGLSAPTAHVNLVDKDADPAFRAAEALGVETLIDPVTRPERWATREGVAEIAASLSALASPAADLGMRVGYHNHWWELEHKIDGAPALEVFADLLDPRVVLEVDAYWAAVGGVSPAELLRTLGDRVVALHIKDGPLTRDASAQVPAGSGSLPLDDVLAAAPTARAVIEFDEYAGDLFDGIAASREALLARGVSA